MNFSFEEHLLLVAPIIWLLNSIRIELVAIRKILLQIKENSAPPPIRPGF